MNWKWIILWFISMYWLFNWNTVPAIVILTFSPSILHSREWSVNIFINHFHVRNFDKNNDDRQSCNNWKCFLAVVIFCLPFLPLFISPTENTILLCISCDRCWWLMSVWLNVFVFVFIRSACFTCKYTYTYAWYFICPYCWSVWFCFFVFDNQKEGECPQFELLIEMVFVKWIFLLFWELRKKKREHLRIGIGRSGKKHLSLRFLRF